MREAWIQGDMRASTRERLEELNYEVGRRVGGGGNGEVFALRHRDGDQRVVKILREHKSRSAKELRRFDQEVALQRRFEATGGVLKLFEAFTPARTEARSIEPFYVMPLAETPPFLARNPPPFPEVLSCFAEVGRTLVRLHTEGVSHRDIKPGNILRFGGTTVLTDFGLALDDQNPTGLTAGQDRLGPQGFIPDELLNDPASALGGPVDVFEWAKTLWVCLAGVKYPPQSALRSDVPTHQIASVQPTFDVTYRSVQRLLERATNIDPVARPSIAECVGELEALAVDHAGPISSEDAVGRLRMLGRRAGALAPPTEPSWRVAVGDLEAAIRVLSDSCSNSFRMLRESALTETDLQPGDYFAAAAAGVVTAQRGLAWRSAAVRVAPPNGIMATMTVAVAVSETGSDPDSLALGAGASFSSINVAPGRLLGFVRRSLPGGSARLPAVADEVASEFQRNLPDWVEEFLDALSPE